MALYPQAFLRAGKGGSLRIDVTRLTIRPAAPDDLPVLERVFPYGPPDKHADRLRRQRCGDVVYLIAWLDGTPVGHALLKWAGAEESHIADDARNSCPDVEDLFVQDAFRSHGIGSKLLAYAEQKVHEGGYNRIGLSVDVENPRAKRLYLQLGYQDSQLGEHYEHGEFTDKAGQLQTWEETCIYLIKPLET